MMRRFVSTTTFGKRFASAVAQIGGAASDKPSTRPVSARMNAPEHRETSAAPTAWRLRTPCDDASGDLGIRVNHRRRDDQSSRLWAAVRRAVIDAWEVRVEAVDRLPVGNAKRDFARSPLVERRRGGDPEQIGEAQDTSRLCAGEIDDAFSCAARPDIALSPPVKTLTLSAIEPADRTEATWQNQGRTVAVLHLGWTLERCNCFAFGSP